MDAGNQLCRPMVPVVVVWVLSVPWWPSEEGRRWFEECNPFACRGVVITLVLVEIRN